MQKRYYTLALLVLALCLTGCTGNYKLSEEEDPIPFDPDSGTRIAQGPDGSVRLRRVYHDDGLSTLVRVAGSLTYQPIDGLYLPPIDIDLG
jgi:hypothetical protein